MEGRTIARPYRQLGRTPSAPCSFNGGPDNCPAIPGAAADHRQRRPRTLQWRAGQLPGHTWPLPSRMTDCRLRSFNGGPDNCPAILTRSSCTSRRRFGLQWRAGQLPGHTTFGGRRAGQFLTPIGDPSMEGRTIARPYWRLARRGSAVPRPRAPSMEGRTIARPYRGPILSGQPPRHGLQWRAGQLPGHTAVRRPSLRC